MLIGLQLEKCIKGQRKMHGEDNDPERNGELVAEDSTQTDV